MTFRRITQPPTHGGPRKWLSQGTYVVETGQNSNECSDPGYGIFLIFKKMYMSFISSFQLSFCFPMKTLHARGS